MSKKSEGAISGAASGAAMGTQIMPGWGTAIGAIAGGLLGAAGAGDDPGREARSKILEVTQDTTDTYRDANNFLRNDLGWQREQQRVAAQQLAGLYGLPGGRGSQQGFIRKAKQSPLYDAIMGTQKAGERAIMRNAAATGGLRSGSTQANLADYNQRLAEKALLHSYNERMQGLQGFAALPRGTEQIYQGIRDVADVGAQGRIAAMQAKLAGEAGSANNMLAMGQAGAGMMQGMGGLSGITGMIGGMGGGGGGGGYAFGGEGTQAELENLGIF